MYFVKNALITFVLPLFLFSDSLGVEIGFDTGAAVALRKSSRDFAVAIPEQLIRMNFLITEKIGIEPRFGFVHASVSDGLTAFELELHGIIRMQEYQQSGAYFSIGSEIIILNSSGTDADFGVGGGIGYSTSIQDQLSLRFEGRYDFLVEDQINKISCLVGLSFFTK